MQDYKKPLLGQLRGGPADRVPRYSIQAGKLRLARQLGTRSEPPGLDLRAKIVRHLHPEQARGTQIDPVSAVIPGHMIMIKTSDLDKYVAYLADVAYLANLSVR